MAKRFRVSDDAGSNWYTLPGNTAESNDEAGTVADTIFGQDYESNQPTIIGWTMTANGLYKGYAGYLATIKKQGTSTLMTTEAMSLVAGKTYQVTASAKRTFDKGSTLHVFDNAVGKDAEIETIDYLFGRITFKSSYTPTGPITVTANYLPLVAVGCINDFTLTMSAKANDTSCMDTAASNGGYRTFEAGLKTVSLDANGIYKTANGFKALLQSRAEIIIELNPEGSSLAVARGFFRPASTGQSGDVGDLEEEHITFNLSVPDQALMAYPFQWIFAAGVLLNTGVQKVIQAWEAGTSIKVSYLPDGASGEQGDAIITDLSLAGGLEAVNTFDFSFQGTGAKSAYP